LSTRAAGHVYQVFKRVGDRVDKDQVLGLVDAAEVGRGKADFLQALRTFELRSQVYERERQAAASLAARRLQESEAAVAEASIRLFNAQQALANLGLPVDHERLKGLSDKELTSRVRFLGLRPDVVRRLRPGTTTANLIPLAAPFAGTVIRADVVEGELVNSNVPRFTVADVRRLWLILDVRQEDIDLVRANRFMTFRPDGGDADAEGRVSWISTEVDSRTRTVRVRADVTNPDGRLRARSFGSGRIRVAHKDNAAVVPAGAVQWVPHRWVVENMTRSMAPTADQERPRRGRRPVVHGPAGATGHPRGRRCGGGGRGPPRRARRHGRHARAALQVDARRHRLGGGLMLNWVIDTSLRHRFLVLLATFIFVCVYVMGAINIDAFPDTTPVQVQVNAPAPGLAPEVVEQQLTPPTPRRPVRRARSSSAGAGHGPAPASPPRPAACVRGVIGSTRACVPPGTASASAAVASAGSGGRCSSLSALAALSAWPRT
jgi:multidrug efflux pump subunit AcrA (membrane-fusion protein)